jgi:hypothetical protein
VLFIVICLKFSKIRKYAPRENKVPTVPPMNVPYSANLSGLNGSNGIIKFPANVNAAPIAIPNAIQ